MKKIVLLIIILVLTGCSGVKIKSAKSLNTIKTEPVKTETVNKSNEILLSNESDIKNFSESENSEYTLNIGDIVSIKTEYKSIADGQYTVNIEGNLNIEKIGLISVTNKTVYQVEAEINQKISDFFKNEKVVVNYEKINSNVIILGDIEKPGIVSISKSLKLVEALSYAGKIRYNEYLTEKPNIYCRIIRSNGKSIIVNISKMIEEGNGLYNIELKRNDCVYIFTSAQKEKSNVYVLGEVKNPGEYSFNEKLNIVQAIAKAGGINQDGNYSGVYLLRTTEKNQNEIYDMQLNRQISGSLKNMIEMRDGDIVYVAKNKIANVNELFINLMPGLSAASLATGSIYNIRNIK